MVTVTVVFPGSGQVLDVRFDAQQPLVTALGVLLDAGSLTAQDAATVLYRSSQLGRLVSAVRPLHEEGVVDGDMLTAITEPALRSVVQHEELSSQGVAL